MAKKQIEEIKEENMEVIPGEVETQEEVTTENQGNNYDDFNEYLNDPRVEYIIEQKRIIRDALGLPDLMAVDIVMIGIMDTLANTPDLAQMVTIASKYNDGTITPEEAENLYNSLLGGEEEMQGIPADMQEQGGFPSSEQAIEQDLKQGINEAQQGTIVPSTQAELQQPTMEEPKKDNITIRTISVENDSKLGKDESIADFINRKSKQMGFK